ncbi:MULTISPECIES: hypothetical protein [Aequorivita]|uniref:Anti-sigma factor n=1 Tax=Aequorivita iocasae TaxID=2803865 RepID=A0ABX7DS56_9FLAO|nr:MULTISPECIES: hypothetical protein [Aequorivita]QQX76833.1 hypothetical protein JK629_00730 [Aequorivita iocasae]UCA56305.1 hypothetical protein LDL78_00735 [Aequorivita sp. F7]
MAQDIKKMFENYDDPKTPKLREGHQARFEAKLDKAFSENISEEKNTSIPWLKIAAMVVVLLAVSFFGYQQLSKNNTIIDSNKAVVDNATETRESSEAPKLTLADISPDLKKVEEYYMAGINVQLASLKITDDNKDLVDGYMKRLAELDMEYNSLNAELSKVGPTEATVTALIDNLKLRLDLLFKLKNKLKELKNQNNEEFKAIQT